MNLKQAEKHIERLQKLFPKSHIRTTDEFYGTESKNVGLWTGFMEDGTICEYGQDNCGMGYYVDPKLLKYLKKYDLDMEPHDAGTMMIWDWS